MKTLNSLYFSAIFIFSTGLVLKLFKTPFHTILMLVGLGIVFIASFGYLLIRQRNYGLLGLTTFFAGLYLLSVVKFWPQMVLLTILTTFFIITIVVSRRALHNIIARSGILLVLILTGLGLSVMPLDERYFLFNIKYNPHLDADYRTWDKYSWFLYRNDRHNDALKANQRAYEIVLKSDDQASIDNILQHKIAIEKNEWHGY